MAWISNRPFWSSDSLLQFSHFSSQVRLVTHRRRHAAEKCRNFGSCLGESEDVVDEKQNVLMLLVAKVFRDCQSRQPDAQACSRRLRHLPVDEGRFLNDSGFFHLEPEIIAFARALPHSGEDRITPMMHGNPVDHFHDDDCFADAGAAE
jgi:hypothetical protein